jgi:hypothetical protein
VIQGSVEVEGEKLLAGDGAGIQKVDTLKLKWSAGSELIVFDLP